MNTSTEAGLPTGYREVEKSALCRTGEQEIRDFLLANGNSKEGASRMMHGAILAAATECRAFMLVVERWRKNPNPTPSRWHERWNVLALHFSCLKICFKRQGVSDDTATRLAKLYQIKVKLA